MTQFTAPGLGLSSGFVLGQDGWDEEYNADMLKLSVLVHVAVLDRVSDLPAVPANGDRYLLIGTDDSNSVGEANQIAAYSTELGWSFFTPGQGWSVWVVDEQARYEYRSGGWTIVSAQTLPLDVGVFIGGTMTGDERVATYVCTRAFTLEDDFASSQGYAVSGDDTDLVISIRKNGVQIGTATFAADSNSAFSSVTFEATDSNSVPGSFVAGDRLEFFAPASPGAWADVAITLYGTRV